jgi:hypothetical protein
MTVYGPHCSHDECSWVTCGESGLVEYPCRKPGCPHCGAPGLTAPEAWASDPARVATFSAADQERVRVYLAAYPLVSLFPGDTSDRLSAPQDADADWEPCHHECDENCEDGCSHQHCFACGQCQCAGYCDDYQTYNLRPSETGGAQ